MSHPIQPTSITAVILIKLQVACNQNQVKWHIITLSSWAPSAQQDDDDKSS